MRAIITDGIILGLLLIMAVCKYSKLVPSPQIFTKELSILNKQPISPTSDVLRTT